MNDIFNWNQEMTVKPVGIVISELKTPSLSADQEGISSTGNAEEMLRQTNQIRNMVSEIVIHPSLQGILDGLQDFSHAIVLYWPHLAKDGSRDMIRVHPMGRKDLAKVGIFSSCSPARPNPILVTAVEVMGIEGNTLKVKGLEAVNGSPVLDIKPYNRHYLEVQNLKLADWMEQVEQALQ